MNGVSRGAGCWVYYAQTAYLKKILYMKRVTTVREAQKRQLKQPQMPILFWPSNILAVAVKSRKGLSFEEQLTLC
jgi:hypothetical protein